MNIGKTKPKKPKNFEFIDSLFLDKTTHAVNEVGKYFEAYEYSKAKQEAETFFYKVFTDNYLEIVKKRIYKGKGEKKLSAQYALYNGLLSIIKMIAPIMPFITEEIYQTYYRRHEKDKSIHVSKWPKITVFGLDGARWDTIFWDTFIDIVTKVRQKKTKAKKPMNSEIILYAPEINDPILREESGILEDLKNVTNAREVKTGKFKVKFVK